MLELESWETPATRYKRKKVGRARVVSTPYREGFYGMFGVRAADGQRYQHYEAVKPLKVTSLRIDRETVMVDDPPHWYACREYAAGYHGHVLCAGLGLGLIVHALKTNPKVTQITVVERNPDVIDLIWPHLAPTGRPEGGPLLTLWRGDWFDVQPAALAELVAPVDGIFFDLLVGESRELFGAAMYAVKDMRARWPGVPHQILGFHAAALNETFEEVEAANAALAALTPEELAARLSVAPVVSPGDRDHAREKEAEGRPGRAAEPARRAHRGHAGPRSARTAP